MSISYQHAIKAIDASIEKATALGVAVSLAVVDINGYLVAFARLDRNGDMIDFAVKKAKTALLFEEVDDRLEIMAVRTSNYGQRMFGFTKNMLAIGGTAPIKIYRVGLSVLSLRLEVALIKTWILLEQEPGQFSNVVKSVGMNIKIVGV